MKSFIIKLQDFFQFNRNNTNNGGYPPGILKYLIPLYQREYKWEDDKIEGLVQDINNRDKFLGNIILDEKIGMPTNIESVYEIVDGQQRITTSFLIFIALYNQLHGMPMEQQSIILKINQNHQFNWWFAQALEGPITVLRLKAH